LGLEPWNRLQSDNEKALIWVGGGGGWDCRRGSKVCRRACVRARIALGGQAGGSGDRVSAYGDGVRADTADGGVSQKAGLTGGSQKRKKSSPVKIKDL